MAWELFDNPLRVHRLISSRFPPVQLFDWAASPEELEEIAALEGLTNDRLQTEYGKLSLVAKEDWISGTGASPLMAAFTHPGNSRFSDGTFGVYYAADSIETAIEETKFHRTRFLKASNESPHSIEMREYVATVQRPMIILNNHTHAHLLAPDPTEYSISQAFAKERREEKAWGLYYPSVRNPKGICIAIFRPPALSIPIQSRHFEYIWDGSAITQVTVLQRFEPALA